MNVRDCIDDEDVELGLALFGDGWNLDDLLDLGIAPAGEPWPTVPAADLAAMAHAASAVPPVVFDADPFTVSAPPTISVDAAMEVAVVESPIERLLLRAILEVPRELGPPAYPDDAVCEPVCCIGSWIVSTQRRVLTKPYRFDIAIESGAGGLIVEADGHEFHEKTPEQVARDKRRDRWCQLQGWVVLRFSGREICRDARACAAEVFEHLRGLEARGSH